VPRAGLDQPEASIGDDQANAVRAVVLQVLQERSRRAFSFFAPSTMPWTSR
jgi:hypothetical protein